VSNKTPAEKARELLDVNEVTSEMITVRDYPCSDNCGPGPRFLTQRNDRTPVCWNLDELKENIKIAACKGEELVKLIF